MIGELNTYVTSSQILEDRMQIDGVRGRRNEVLCTIVKEVDDL
jgi:hypothetical protein